MKTLAEFIDELQLRLAEKQSEVLKAGDGMSGVMASMLLPLQAQISELSALQKSRWENEIVAFDLDGRTHVSRCEKSMDGLSVVRVDGVQVVLPTDTLRTPGGSHDGA